MKVGLTKELDVGIIPRILYVGGFLLALYMCLITEDPLWFIAAFIVDIAGAFCLFWKYEELKWKIMK